MQDNERYILTTNKASVIRDVLSLVFEAVGSEDDGNPGGDTGIETFAESGCDRMILELQRPKGTAAGISPRVRNLRISRLGRVLVVTGKATSPGILRDLDARCSPWFFPRNLASDLAAPFRSLFRTLHLADSHN